MEILGAHRNYRLWTSTVNHIHGPLHFVWYHLDTPYDILTHFQNLQMLELGHWVDFLEEADDNEEPPQADNLTGYLSQSLVDLRLVCLQPGAVRHFVLWLASHQVTAGKMQPVNKLQVFNLECWDSMLELVFFLIQWEGTLQSLRIKPTVWYIIWDCLLLSESEDPVIVEMSAKPMWFLSLVHKAATGDNNEADHEDLD
ncbi:hypothetical protein C8J56DRAFT_892889 [Mycena floridula]|nr:hypothetical protein C8J56DRAFT_892889 [Mycena floridula]